MIACFPDPFPDELLYSVCARFHSRLQYSNKKSVLQELFDSSSCTAIVDLPCRLGSLVAALPPGHNYSVDQLIDNHTLLPFFSSFLPPEQITKIREDMYGSGGLKVHRRSGLMASRIPTPELFRFCPECVLEDRNRNGETYWHRIHQLPGVLVCPIHSLLLENTNVRRNSSRDSLRFVPAEDAVRSLPARPIDLSNHTHQVLLKLAQDAAWLLGQTSRGADPNAIYNRYLKLLIDRSFCTYTGCVHVEPLLSSFREHYSPDVLTLLHCEFNGRDQVKTNWLLRLVRRPKHAQHSLYHLLLIRFLGFTVEDFF